jgi:hypothetical protein
MAGTHTVTKDKIAMGSGSYPNYITVIDGTFTADAADGSIPDATVVMNGWLIKVQTNPGSTAPTDNWDIKFLDPFDTAFDAARSQLLDRDTTTSDEVYPAAPNAVTPILLGGSYLINITGNSVNSATGAYKIFIKDIV